MAQPAAAHSTDFGHAVLTIGPSDGARGTTVDATYVYHPPRDSSCPSGTVAFLWDGAVQGSYPMNQATCSASAAISVPPDAAGGPHQVCASAPPFPACAAFAVEGSAGAGTGQPRPPTQGRGLELVAAAVSLTTLLLVGVALVSRGRRRRRGADTADPRPG